jgi:hypothetical protein
VVQQCEAEKYVEKSVRWPDAVVLLEGWPGEQRVWGFAQVSQASQHEGTPVLVPGWRDAPEHCSDELGLDEKRALARSESV